jgi:hypothetical protein
MRNKQKGSVTIWIIIFVIVVLLVGLLNYYGRQNNLVSGLKSHIDSDFGYKIQYPEKFTLNDHRSTERDIIELEQHAPNSLRIAIIASMNKPNPIAINDECVDVSSVARQITLGSNKFNLTVIEGARGDIGDQLLSSERRYYLKNPQNCYLIVAYYPPLLTDSEKSDLLKEADSVVSTFTLI